MLTPVTVPPADERVEPDPGSPPEPAVPELSPDVLLGLISTVTKPEPETESGQVAVEQEKPAAAKIPAFSTWPPAGVAAVQDPLRAPGKGGGAGRSGHRPGVPRRSRTKAVVAVVAVVAAICGVAGWTVMRHKGSSVSWDPRVAGLAAFASTHTGIGFPAPVTVSFVPPGKWAADVAGNPSSVPGANAARWVPSHHTLYVVDPSPGAPLSLYTDLAVVGQLTWALESGTIPGSSKAAAGAAAQVKRVQAAYINTLTPAARAALAKQMSAR